MHNRDHFEQYGQQNAVKHAIIEKYLRPYFDILKAQTGRVLYIDAFAGPGYYKDGDEVVPGSPIRSLQLLLDRADLREKARLVFSEPDPVLFKELEQSVQTFCEDEPDLERPILVNFQFEELVSKLVEQYGADLAAMAPAFVLVDPCGVKGVGMGSICTLLRKPFTECFVFLNSMAVKRVVGAGLDDLAANVLGSQAAVDAIRDAMARQSPNDDPDQVILREYERALRESGKATYICPFRIEYRDRESTSHYLIHASKHSRAFTIMKDVMWSVGESDQMEFCHGRQLGPTLFSTVEAVDLELLSALQVGRRRVGELIDSLAVRPEDRVAPGLYKRRIIHLEADGKVVVVSKDGSGVVTATDRPPRLGQPTLANEYFVQLS